MTSHTNMAPNLNFVTKTLSIKPPKLLQGMKYKSNSQSILALASKEAILEASTVKYKYSLQKFQANI